MSLVISDCFAREAVTSSPGTSLALVTVGPARHADISKEVRS